MNTEFSVGLSHHKSWDPLGKTPAPGLSDNKLN